MLQPGNGDEMYSPLFACLIRKRLICVETIVLMPSTHSPASPIMQCQAVCVCVCAVWLLLHTHLIN